VIPVSWAPEVALEIVAAGVRAVSKRVHPDRPDGSHQAMIVLTATAGRLRAAIGAGLPTAVARSWADRPHRRPAGDIPPLAAFDPAGRWVYCDDVESTATKELAIFCTFPTGVQHWVPFSQLHRRENDLWERGDSGRLVFSAWFAQRKGWW